MKTTIYYFSASGNSFKIAKDICDNIEKCIIIDVKDVIEQEHITNSTERIGIITPVYAWGPPRIISEFLEKSDFSEKSYLFAIANSGGVTSSTINQMNQILKKKGQAFTAGFSVKAKALSLFEDSFPVTIAKTLAGNKRLNLKSYADRQKEIISIIVNREEHKLEGTNVLTDLYGFILHKSVMKVFKVSDSKFEVLSSCKGCNKCINECPRKNILKSEEILKWNNNCELCYGCMVRCPQKAIVYRG